MSDKNREESKRKRHESKEKRLYSALKNSGKRLQAELGLRSLTMIATNHGDEYGENVVNVSIILGDEFAGSKAIELFIEDYESSKMSVEENDDDDDNGKPKASGKDTPSGDGEVEL